jgi:hypothetical protein
MAWPAADRSRALVAAAPRGGPFSAPQTAPGPVGFRTSALAFSPDGHGAILSAVSPGYAVGLGQPEGSWGALERVTTERVSFIRVAVGDGGGVLLAWTALAPCGPPVPHTFVAQCDFLRAVVRPPGGVFGPPNVLDCGQVSGSSRDGRGARAEGGGRAAHDPMGAPSSSSIATRVAGRCSARFRWRPTGPRGRPSA